MNCREVGIARRCSAGRRFGIAAELRLMLTVVTSPGLMGGKKWQRWLSCRVAMYASISVDHTPQASVLTQHLLNSGSGNVQFSTKRLKAPTAYELRYDRPAIGFRLSGGKIPITYSHLAAVWSGALRIPRA